MNRLHFFCSLAFAFLIALTSAHAVAAQTRSVLVERRDGDITILPNGDIRFVETWHVKFTGGPFTNANRAIPKNAVSNVFDWGVSEDGQEYKSSSDHSTNTYSLTDEGNARKITWYFPATTNKTRTFVLRYTVRGALRAAQNDREQWNWIFVESGRGYTINASKVTLHLPKAFNAQDIKPGAGKVSDGQTIEYTGGPFTANAQWLIQVEYPRATSGLPTLTPPTPTPIPSTVTALRRDADISLLPNGDAQFVETWQMRFTGNSFRDATRTFALTRVDELTEWSVSEGSQQYEQRDAGESPNTFFVSKASSGLPITLRWYFAPATNETRSFTIRYTARGLVRQSAKTDEFFWTFIERDHSYTITNARVVIHLPGDFDASQVAASVAPQIGKSDVGDGKTVVFTGGPFPANIEWAVRAKFPHGAITADAPRWQFIEDRQPIFNLIALFLALVILIGGLASVFLVWYNRGRDRAVGVIAEYYTSPPENIPPGMAGALIDERVDLQDLVATIVDLARRGFFRIAEITSGVQTYTRLDADKKVLRVYESTLLEKIFRAGDQVRAADVGKTFRSKDLQEVTYYEMVGAGWFIAHPGRARGLFATAGVLATLFVCVCGFGAYALISDYAPLAILVWFALGIVALAPIAFAPFMSKRTPKGATLTAKVRAFENYLQHIEKYTKLEEAKDQFEKYLPYAIAFGIEQTWVQQFATVDTPAPMWYAPYVPSDVPGSTFEENPPNQVAFSRAILSRYGGYDRERFEASQRIESETNESPLNDATRGAFTGLNAMTGSLFTMLNTTASALGGNEPQHESSPSGGGSSSFGTESRSSGSSSSSDSSSSWSSSSSDSSSSWSSSSNDTGGGGSSGFGS